MYQSEQINELALALSKMQQEVGTISKNKTVAIPTKMGGKINFSYADLACILDTIRKPMSKNELSVSQVFTTQDNGAYHIVTTLMHSSGQWLKSTLPINVHATDIKQLGSQITYSRRYALTAMLGICADDDNEEVLEGNNSTNGNGSAPKLEKVEKISKSQAEELKGYFLECEATYQKNYFAYLQSKAKGMKDLSDLPLSMFDNVKETLLKKMEGYKKDALEDMKYA